MNMTAALQWAQRSTQASPQEVARAQELVLASLELHRVVYDLGLVFCGLACLVLGHLLRISRIVPSVLGVGLSIAGLVYLVGSFTVVLAPAFAPTPDPMYGLTVLAELSLAVWLAIPGSRVTDLRL
jgi:hypothetical protein